MAPAPARTGAPAAAPQKPVNAGGSGKLIGLIAGGIAVLLLLGLGGYFLFFGGGPHQVIVVNGLNRAYTVDINGKTVSLDAYEHKTVELPNGRVELTNGRGDGVTIPDSTFDLSASSKTQTFILNPDGCALLAVSERPYGHSGARGGADAGKRLLGQFHVVDRIDFAFTGFPATLSGNPGIRRALSMQKAHGLDWGDLVRSRRHDLESANAWRKQVEPSYEYIPLEKRPVFNPNPNLPP